MPKIHRTSGLVTIWCFFYSFFVRVISALFHIALNKPKTRFCSCVAQLLSCKKTSCNVFESVLFITHSSLGMVVSSLVHPFVQPANQSSEWLQWPRTQTCSNTASALFMLWRWFISLLLSTFS